MIRSNGNGTYSVDFQVNGKDDYVTVDSELPTNGAYGLYYAKTGSDDFDLGPARREGLRRTHAKP